MKRHSNRRDDLSIDTTGSSSGATHGNAATNLSYANMKTRKVTKLHSPSKLRSPGKSKTNKHGRIEKHVIYGVLVAVIISFTMAGIIFFILLFGTPWISSTVINTLKGAYEYIRTKTPKYVFVEENITPSEFRDSFVEKKPLLFIGDTTEKGRIDIMHLLHGSYSNVKITADLISILGRFNLTETTTATKNSFFFQSKLEKSSYTAVETTFSKFLKMNSSGDEDYNPYYIMEGNVMNRMPNLRKVISVPALLSCDDNNVQTGKTSKFPKESKSSRLRCPFTNDGNFVLSIGNREGGMSFHAHGESWSELLHGKKLWYLYKPNEMSIIGFDPSESTAFWGKTEYQRIGRKDMPYEVIQEEGQVLYIPEGWLHASITLSNISIAVSQNSIIFKPHSNLYYMAEAVKKGNKGQYEDAVQQLRWALKEDKNDAMLQYQLGEYLVALGEAEEAEAAFMVAMVRNYKNPDPYIQITALREAEQFEDKTESIKDLLLMASTVGVTAKNKAMASLYEKYGISPLR